MKHSDISIKALNTYESIERAIESIERDPSNIQGGFKAWNSGYETYLLKGAETKIKALRAKQDKIFKSMNLVDCQERQEKDYGYSIF